MSEAIDKEELEKLVGTELGVSDWITIDQERIDQFADVADDHQFIHVDPVRAAATPFGGTIAHGFMTLSLLVPLCLEYIPTLRDRAMVLNYGLDRVRFIAPVRAGRRIRARCTLGEVTERKFGQFLFRVDVVVEIENEAKPALAAQWLSLHIVRQEPAPQEVAISDQQR